MRRRTFADKNVAEKVIAAVVDAQVGLEVLAAAAGAAAAQQTAVPKVYRTHFVPYLRRDDSPMQIKLNATKCSDVLDSAKAYLNDEYLQVKLSKKKYGSIPKLAEYYELNQDWFCVNRKKLLTNKTTDSKRKGSKGGKRKWTPELSAEAREVNKTKFSRRASNRTLAAALGVDRRTVDRNFKVEEYIYRRIRPRPKLTAENILTRNDFVLRVFFYVRILLLQCKLSMNCPIYASKSRYRHANADPEGKNHAYVPQYPPCAFGCFFVPVPERMSMKTKI